MAPRRRRRSYSRDDFRVFYPHSAPREARGGIKARSRRGAFGESWWARRWIEVLEGFQLGARLGRGRNYARRGQVTGVEVAEGSVRASVQGSRARPYSVTIRVKTLDADEWRMVVETLRREAVHAAKLLAGEMPPEIEKVFAEAGVSLFPSRGADLETDCSCPDWSNPCKHIAAVYYLLGEEFDRDPFLIFRLRGLDRDRLLALLSGGAPAGAHGERISATGHGTTPPEGSPSSPPEPLPAEPATFWAGASLPGEAAGDPGVAGAAVLPLDVTGDPDVARVASLRTDSTGIPGPAGAAALPRRLGGFPFWRGEEDLLEALDAVYGRAAAAALEILAGGSADEGDRDRA
jgi:uncharacterized Zn finger protein